MRVLENGTRSFRYIGEAAVTHVDVMIEQIPNGTRTLPSDGITDIVGGVLIQPISAKYPGLGYIRWLLPGGFHNGDESAIEFLNTRFLPPSNSFVGFEIWIKKGTVYNVEIEEGVLDVNADNYYVKSEVDSRISNAVGQVSSDLLALINQKSSIGHSHQIVDITGLQDALNSKAAISALASKADSSALQALVETVSGLNGGSVIDSVNTPSSPSVGTLWRERDNSNRIIEEWEWDGTYWLSTQLRSLSFSDVNERAYVFFVLNPIHQPGLIQVTNFSMEFDIGTLNHDANSYMKLQVFRSVSPGNDVDVLNAEHKSVGQLNYRFRFNLNSSDFINQGIFDSTFYLFTYTPGYNGATARGITCSLDYKLIRG